jgi:hypothetical protein
LQDFGVAKHRSDADLYAIIATGEVGVNFDRLNRWLTLGANLGVLLGLVALIVEINQGNALALAQIEQTRSDGLREWRQEWVTNDQIVPMLAKVDSILPMHQYRQLNMLERQAATEKILRELDLEDRIRYQLFISTSYWDLENLYAQYERGLVSEQYWQARIAAILQWAPRWKAANGEQMLNGRPAFNEEVNRLLETYPNGLPDQRVVPAFD